MVMMSVELWCLFGAMVLAVVHISAQSLVYRAQAGNDYMVGARDEVKPATGVAARLDRASRNFMETFPVFAAAVLLVHVTDGAGVRSYWGALVYLGCRFLFLPLYAAGVPWLRTFSWNAATAGIVAVIVEAVV